MGKNVIHKLSFNSVLARRNGNCFALDRVDGIDLTDRVSPHPRGWELFRASRRNSMFWAFMDSAQEQLEHRERITELELIWAGMMPRPATCSALMCPKLDSPAAATPAKCAGLAAARAGRY